MSRLMVLLLLVASGAAQELQLEVLDVTDLLKAPAGRPLEGPGLREERPAPLVFEERSPSLKDMAALRELVLSTVTPEAWGMPGEGPSLHTVGTMLVIRHTADGLQQVRDLLALLRRGRLRSVRVRVELLDAQPGEPLATLVVTAPVGSRGTAACGEALAYMRRPGGGLGGNYREVTAGEVRHGVSLDVAATPSGPDRFLVDLTLARAQGLTGVEPPRGPTGEELPACTWLEWRGMAVVPRDELVDLCLTPAGHPTAAGGAAVRARIQVDSPSPDPAPEVRPAGEDPVTWILDTGDLLLPRRHQGGAPETVLGIELEEQLGGQELVEAVTSMCSPGSWSAEEGLEATLVGWHLRLRQVPAVVACVEELLAGLRSRLCAPGRVTLEVSPLGKGGEAWSWSSLCLLGVRLRAAAGTHRTYARELTGAGEGVETGSLFVGRQIECLLTTTQPDHLRLDLDLRWSLPLLGTGLRPAPGAVPLQLPATDEAVLRVTVAGPASEWLDAGTLVLAGVPHSVRARLERDLW